MSSANPNGLKISNVYKITNPKGYDKLRLVYAQKIGNEIFSFLGSDNDEMVPEPFFVTHQSGNTYNVDDHRQPSKFPPKGTGITIEYDEKATKERNLELDAKDNIQSEARTRRGRRRTGKGKTRKRKRKRKSTKKKRRRKRKRTKKKRRRRRR